MHAGPDGERLAPYASTEELLDDHEAGGIDIDRVPPAWYLYERLRANDPARAVAAQFHNWLRSQGYEFDGSSFHESGHRALKRSRDPIRAGESGHESGHGPESGHARHIHREEGFQEETVLHRDVSRVPIPERTLRRSNTAAHIATRRYLSAFVPRTSADVAMHLGVSTRTAKRVLATLVAEGTARKVGKARATRYFSGIGGP